MTEFDLGALEQALAPKKREPKLKLKPYSREELITQAKRLSKEIEQLYIRRGPSTRHAGSTWSVDRYDQFREDGYPKPDADVPLEVLERLVVNGQKRLKPFHDMINQLMVTTPELALEANLEGKTGYEMLGYAYDQRAQQINEHLHKHLISVSGGPEIFIKFNIMLETLNLKIDAWVGRQYADSISIDGVDKAPRNKEASDKLVFFIQNTGKVIAEIGKQLSQIRIIKEGTK